MRSRDFGWDEVPAVEVDMYFFREDRFTMKELVVLLVGVSAAMMVSVLTYHAREAMFSLAWHTMLVAFACVAAGAWFREKNIVSFLLKAVNLSCTANQAKSAAPVAFSNGWGEPIYDTPSSPLVRGPGVLSFGLRQRKKDYPEDPPRAHSVSLSHHRKHFHHHHHPTPGKAGSTGHMPRRVQADPTPAVARSLLRVKASDAPESGPPPRSRRAGTADHAEAADASGSSAGDPGFDTAVSRSSTTSPADRGTHVNHGLFPPTRNLPGETSQFQPLPAWARAGRQEQAAAPELVGDASSTPGDDFDLLREPGVCVPSCLAKEAEAGAQKPRVKTCDERKKTPVEIVSPSPDSSSGSRSSKTGSETDENPASPDNERAADTSNGGWGDTAGALTPAAQNPTAGNDPRLGARIEGLTPFYGRSLKSSVSPVGHGAGPPHSVATATPTAPSADRESCEHNAALSEATSGLPPRADGSLAAASSPCTPYLGAGSYTRHANGYSSSSAPCYHHKSAQSGGTVRTSEGGASSNGDTQTGGKAKKHHTHKRKSSFKNGASEDLSAEGSLAQEFDRTADGFGGMCPQTDGHRDAESRASSGDDSASDPTEVVGEQPTGQTRYSRDDSLGYDGASPGGSSALQSTVDEKKDGASVAGNCTSPRGSPGACTLTNPALDEEGAAHDESSGDTTTGIPAAHSGRYQQQPSGSRLRWPDEAVSSSGGENGNSGSGADSNGATSSGTPGSCNATGASSAFSVDRQGLLTAVRQAQPALFPLSSASGRALTQNTLLSDGSLPSIRRMRSQTRTRTRRVPYIKCKRLGTSSMPGVTVHAVLTRDGRLLAGKFLDHGSLAAVSQLKREAAILKKLHHPNIVSIVSMHFQPGKVELYEELGDQGTLRNLINILGTLPPWAVQYFGKQILSALVHTHKKHIVHRDIKAENVLLFACGIVKLADFGESCFEDDQYTPLRYPARALHGTPYWMAPEVLAGCVHGTPSDIWSFGCTLHEMAKGLPPNVDKNETAYQAIYRLSLLAASSEVPVIGDQGDFGRVLKRCFTMRPSERPTAVQLQRDPYFDANPASESESSTPDTGSSGESRSSSNTSGANPAGNTTAGATKSSFDERSPTTTTTSTSTVSSKTSLRFSDFLTLSQLLAL